MRTKSQSFKAFRSQTSSVRKQDFEAESLKSKKQQRSLQTGSVSDPVPPPEIEIINSTNSTGGTKFKKSTDTELPLQHRLDCLEVRKGKKRKGKEETEKGSHGIKEKGNRIVAGKSEEEEKQNENKTGFMWGAFLLVINFNLMRTSRHIID
ncbi:hypothetical protein SLEP1_g34279 [Rubroshorea leprosula]|uniref:Uncharacterized protein n=1 Tax=Rubroshorea leprosula TaxID=152421 RepID=A0AAV5KJA0_9ROSI|nr:hypothetical protein SLEP1_g34279 [Rubroshorea leprosula]